MLGKHIIFFVRFKIRKRFKMSCHSYSFNVCVYRLYFHAFPAFYKLSVTLLAAILAVFDDYISA